MMVVERKAVKEVEEYKPPRTKNGNQGFIPRQKDWKAYFFT